MENHITDDEKARRKAERRRKQTALRLKHSFTEIKRAPQKIIAPAIIAVVFILCWQNRDGIIGILHFRRLISQCIIATILTYTLHIIMIALFVLILLICLKLIGTPRHVSRIEKGLAEVFRNTVSYGRTPIYVSREPVGTFGAIKYVFFSEWVSRDVWIEKRENVAHLLRGHILGEIENGGRSGNDTRYIVIHIGSGAKPIEHEAPEDPFFRK